MRKMLQIVLSIFLLLFATSACGTKSETETSGEENERVVSVEVAEVTEGDLTIERSVYGRTAPNQTTPIIPQAPGEVEELEVGNGDLVKEDDVIATVLTAAGKQTLRAPTAGEIVRLHASEGEVVSNEESFAMVADLSKMKLDFAVTSGVRDLFLQDGSLPAIINGKEHQAKITQVDKLPNETGLYPVVATVENAEGTMLPGMVADLVVPEKQIAGAILVPTASIVEEEGETFVYVVREERAAKQIVTVLATQSEQTAIEAGGVQPGNQLVVTGQLTLSDDAHVKVVKGE